MHEILEATFLLFLMLLTICFCGLIAYLALAVICAAGDPASHRDDYDGAADCYDEEWLRDNPLHDWPRDLVAYVERRNAEEGFSGIARGGALEFAREYYAARDPASNREDYDGEQ